MNSKPIKREEFLKHLSREHHHALLLCWKIRNGIKRDVSIQRMNLYIQWFYANYLKPHIAFEEAYIYPLVPTYSAIVDLLSEHRQIEELAVNNFSSVQMLNYFGDLLEKHIRFEERILFNELQRIISKSQIEVIQSKIKEEAFIENDADKFWEK
jgi:hemerythrin-like domain-containing protein